MEDHFVFDHRIVVEVCNPGRADPAVLGEAPPVIDVWQREIVEAAGKAGGPAVTHDGDVNDLRDLAAEDARKMADAAGVLILSHERTRTMAWDVIEIAPD